MRAIPTQTSCGTITVSSDDGDNGDGDDGDGEGGDGIDLGTGEIIAGAGSLLLLLWYFLQGG